MTEASRGRSALPWAELAHELRGPIGVVQGALEEADGDDPMLALARRGARQLELLAQAWGRLGSGVAQPVRCGLSEVVDAAQRTFAELEPRRASRLSVARAEAVLVTDRERLELGLVRLFAHLTRGAAASIHVEIGPSACLGFRGDGDLGVPADLGAVDIRDLWARSARLATAVLLLEPLTERWEQDQERLLWCPTPFTEAPLPTSGADVA